MPPCPSLLYPPAVHPAITAAASNDTEAWVTFVGGARLRVHQIRTKRGRAAGWSACLNVPGEMAQFVHTRDREAAAAQALTIWRQWVRESQFKERGFVGG